MALTPQMKSSLHTEGDPHRIIVLLYSFAPHESRAGGQNGKPEPEGVLRRHLELLDRWGFTLITFSDYRLFLRGELHLPRSPLILTFDDSARGSLPRLAKAFRETGGRAVLFVTTRAFEAGWSEAAGTPPVRPDDLFGLMESGVEIGSLTCTGRPLPSLPPDIAASELKNSKETLELLLDVPVHSCAYPHDAVTPDIKKLAIRAGYDFAAAGNGGPAVFGTDLFEIRRQGVSTMTSALGLAVRVFNPRQRFMRIRRKSLTRLIYPNPPLRIPARP